MKKIACVIPARLQSSRFPRKILAPLHGKPLLQWVWEAACKVPVFDTVIVAVDAEESAQIVKQFGGTAIFTSPDCPSGTMRICELVRKGAISADFIVGWQCDEPFVHASMIADLLQSVQDDSADIWTLKKQANRSEADSPHTPKVVTDAQGRALYFSRSVIPFYRDENNHQIYYKHIGLYAYRKTALLKIGSFSISPLEAAEKLEQLTFLYEGLHVRVHETQHDSIGIDLPEHLAAAELWIANNTQKRIS